MDKDTAKSIIEKVRLDYDTIAEHFSQTRYREWYEFYDFNQYLSKYAKILDLGCGNGRLLYFFSDRNIDYTGLDLSEKIINLAKQLAKQKKQEKKYFPLFSFMVSDLTELPFNNETFDVVFAIASLYHVPSKNLRTKAFQEINRVLKPNGTFIMSYWNMWHLKRVKLIFSNIWKKIIGRSKLDFFDIEKPWKNSEGKILAKRYCHAFTMREITKLVKKANMRIQKKFYSQKRNKAYFWNGFNGVIIAKKR